MEHLRRLFVQAASWDADGNLTGVTFFSPREVLEARGAESLNAEMAKGPSWEGGLDAGIWEVTPEMKAHQEAYDAATDPQIRLHHATQFQKLLEAQVSYRSSS